MPRTIATNTAVDLNALLDFVRPRYRMILVTRRRDGSPQIGQCGWPIRANSNRR